MVKSGSGIIVIIGSKPRVKGNIGGGAEHLESRIVSLESLCLSHAVQVLSQIGGKGFCLQQKNTNTNEFDVQLQTKWHDKDKSLPASCTPWRACAAQRGSRNSCLRGCPVQ